MIGMIISDYFCVHSTLRSTENEMKNFSDMLSIIKFVSADIGVTLPKSTIFLRVSRNT